MCRETTLGLVCAAETLSRRYIFIFIRWRRRHGERDPEATKPPEGIPVATLVEPAAKAVTTSAPQSRNAAGVAHRFVHDNDVPQTHGFHLLFRELLTDEAGQFGVRLCKSATRSLSADLLRDQIVVLEKHALENADIGRNTVAGDAEVDDTVFFKPATSLRLVNNTLECLYDDLWVAPTIYDQLVNCSFQLP